jgi:hypothetical protein
MKIWQELGGDGYIKSGCVALIHDRQHPFECLMPFVCSTRPRVIDSSPFPNRRSTTRPRSCLLGSWCWVIFGVRVVMAGPHRNIDYIDVHMVDFILAVRAWRDNSERPFCFQQ